MRTFISGTKSRPDGATTQLVSRVLRSPAQPLDASTRRVMESRFHHDFSRVRVHTSAEASESAHALRALAYTVGRDVVFRAGHYAPATQLGNDLIEHELGHVVKQESRSDLGIQRQAEPGEKIDPDEPPNKTAHRLAHPRSGNFPGAGVLSRFGVMRGKYFRHIGWPKKRKKVASEYEWKNVVVGKKLVRIDSIADGDEHLHFDTMKDMMFSNLEYYGEAVTRTFHQAAMGGVFADPPDAAVPKDGTFVDTTNHSTVTGVLKYSLGEASGSRKYRKGRIIVNALSDDVGTKKTAVYDSGWLTTHGDVKTLTLNDLPPDHLYEVVVGVEEWRGSFGGYTEYFFDLQLHQDTRETSTFEVPIKKREKVRKTPDD